MDFSLYPNLVFDSILMNILGGVNERKSAGSSSIYSHDSETPFIKRSISQDTDIQQVNGGPRYSRSGSRTTEKQPSRIMGQYLPAITDYINVFFWVLQKIVRLLQKKVYGA